MIEIPITRGEVALIDDEDFDLVWQFSWQLTVNIGTTRYAVATGKQCNKIRGRFMSMQALIMNFPEHYCIDHRDGNGLNNQKLNLRTCDKSQNAWNRKIKSNNTSGVKGVHWRNGIGVWQARISVRNKRIVLGSFKTKEEASDVYFKACLKYHGEFAFPDGHPNAARPVIAPSSPPNTPAA